MLSIFIEKDCPQLYLKSFENTVKLTKILLVVISRPNSGFKIKIASNTN